MKTRFILFVALFAVAVSVGFAQSVKITSKKTTYKRTQKGLPDFKRTFEITTPIVAGTNGKLIGAILNYEKAFDFKIKEQISEENWLDSCDYKVNYNKNNILGVELYMEGSGAYPSVSIKRFVINTANGTRVKPSDVFTNLSGLAALGRKKQQAEIKKANEEYKKDADSADLVDNEYFKNADFKAENLWAFSVTDKGITFHYDYEFPHVILALQPDGEYFYKWSELKSFIKNDGLFGVFVK